MSGPDMLQAIARVVLALGGLFLFGALCGAVLDSLWARVRACRLQGHRFSCRPVRPGVVHCECIRCGFCKEEDSKG